MQVFDVFEIARIILVLSCPILSAYPVTCRGVALQAHQAIIAPLSPLLADLFKPLTCPHQPQPITIVLDLDPQLVIAFLSLIYRGSANLARSRISDLKEVFKMFDLKLPGGFNQSHEPQPALRASSTDGLNVAANAPEMSPLVTQPWPPPTSSNSPSGTQVSRGPRGRMVRKRGGGISRGGQGHPPPRKRRREEDRLEAHLALTNALKDALPGAVAKCTMPGCGEKLSWSDLASHFLVHKKEETSDAINSNGSLTVQGKSPLGPDRKQANQEVLEKLRQVLGDSSSSDDEEDEVAESSALVPTARFPSPLLTTAGNLTSGSSASPPEEAREDPCEVKCADCGLPLDFAHQRHHCTAQPQAQCTLCTPSVTFKTVKARAVHMKTYHGYGAPKTPKLASIGEKKHGCQICTKTYTEFAKLRTHYTLYHFWERLEEDYSGRGEVCNICSVRFPTHDHLLQHLGNFHCLIDPYLVRKGLRMVSHEKTIRLKGARCEICQVAQPSTFALKTHLSVKHFYKELKAEFPTASAKERKCPKCYKTYAGSTVAFVIGHIGSIHDEVLKYAANYLDMDATDRSLLPVDDFDDDTVGVPFEKEKTPGGVGNPGALGRGPFECLVCQICLLQESNPKALKQHYLGHYREQVMAKVASNGLAQCPFCTNILHNMAEAVTHVTSAHLRQVLDNIFFVTATSSLIVDDNLRYFFL